MVAPSRPFLRENVTRGEAALFGVARKTYSMSPARPTDIP
jgi:hypothetical protein